MNDRTSKTVAEEMRQTLLNITCRLLPGQSGMDIRFARCDVERIDELCRRADETFDVREENRKICAAEGHVLGVIARPCLRCHEWFDPQYRASEKANEHCSVSNYNGDPCRLPAGHAGPHNL